jgi:phosphatidyl-myo-inositol alpha-mannosyltransferase
VTSGDHRPLRVALVCPYDLDMPGGVQTHVRALGGALRNLGDEVTILGPSRTGDDPSMVALGGSIRVPFNRSVAPIAVSPLAARRVSRALLTFAPEVVHVHEPAVPMVALAATWRSPRPAVGTFHAWSASDRVYRAARPLLRPVLGRLAARIAVSGPAATFHAQALGLDPSDFTVIPNGVEVARFASATPDPGLSSDVPTLLFVGRLEPRKGLEHLLAALTTLRRNGTEARLLVVGGGSGRDAPQTRLPEDIRTAVTFLGRVDDHDLPRCYASADLFVAPSLGGESFGVVLVEAMAAGVPVVASSIPGYRSVATDGEDAVLVPPGDADALAAALAGLLDDPESRRRLSDGGRRTAAGYDWSVVAARVREVYTEALAAS